MRVAPQPVLSSAGRAKLDEIALKLHGGSIESIEAVGHADREPVTKRTRQ